MCEGMSEYGMYAIRVRMISSDLNAEFADKNTRWIVTSKDFVTVEFPYADNRIRVTLVDAVQKPPREPRGSFNFVVNSISDAFWMVIALTASELFELETNEPVQLLKRALRLP